MLKIWDIIWDGSPFHYATAIVLILAICVELYSVFSYLSKFRTTQTAIHILKKWLKRKNSNPRSDKVRCWLNEHLGTDQH
jgi:hypothetical protein